jgi:hypothetical protein
MDLVEAGGADGQLSDDQRCPSVAEHVDASSDRAVVGIPGHSVNFLVPPLVRLVLLLYSLQATVVEAALGVCPVEAEFAPADRRR